MRKCELGQISSDRGLLGRRDAFHVPAILVRCIWPLVPGQPVKLLGEDAVCPTTFDNADGIVDPLLRGNSPSEEEGLFWVLIFPEKIGDLTHHFTVTGVDNERGEHKRYTRPSLHLEGDDRGEELAEEPAWEPDEDPEDEDDGPYCDYSNC